MDVLSDAFPTLQFGHRYSNVLAMNHSAVALAEGAVGEKTLMAERAVRSPAVMRVSGNENNRTHLRTSVDPANRNQPNARRSSFDSFTAFAEQPKRGSMIGPV